MKKFLAFVLSCFMALPAFVSCDGNSQQSEEPTNKLHIATTTSDFTKFCENDEERIRALYNAGFRYIDLSMYAFTADCAYMQEGWEDVVMGLKATADELGMEFVQAHSQGGNPLSENQADVDFLVDATIRSIEICGLLGIENTVVHAGVADGLTKEQWFDANKAFYEKLLPTAEECNVNVLCENSTKANMGDAYYINTGKDMREFIEYVNHPNFHGCWDTGHANCEGDQYDDIMALGDEMYAIHYTDNGGLSDEHLLLYFGTLDNDEVMRALKDVGFNGYFTMECDGYVRRSRTWKGPTDLPIFKELTHSVINYSREEQERLLYETAEYLLRSYNMLAD